MSLQKIFWVDPYLQELDAVVTTVKDGFITVDKTIAFAFSGGQMSDSGTIGGYEILEATVLHREILYKLPQNHKLQPGDNAKIKIDWAKRYKIMRLHFAAEIVLELIYRTFDNPPKKGANITDEKARIDFFWSGDIGDIFPDIYDKLQDIIVADNPIISAYSGVENQRRYWEIEGFAKVPCSGTHLKRTGEIGKIKLRRKTGGLGKERVEIYLDN